MKLTKRKGFNFFRSYYDVYNELNDSDKVAFMDALLDRQFLGIKPKTLKGMAKFAYISQTNSIDSQVKGYEDKTKTRLDGSSYFKTEITPTQGGSHAPTQGGNQPPAIQEEEKEEEQLITNTPNSIKNIEVVDYSYIKTFIQEIPTNKHDQWREVFYSNNKIKPNNLSKLLDRFEKHCIEYNKPKHKDIGKFKSHFSSWVKGEDMKGRLTDFKRR